MSGLSFLTNLAGEVNGYKQAQNEQNAQDYAQAARANSELQMLAQQQTYQPQAQAQAAGFNLSAARSNAGLSLLPGATQVAQTQQQTQQSAADAALARQPTLNQTADNQATVQQGVTGTQAQLLPQTQANMRLDQLSQDQQRAMTSTAGLYGAMINGPDAVRNYVQKEADSGAYPELAGKQVGQVGLTPDGQTFVALDTQGNTLINAPVSHIQQAYQMTMPTEWHNVDGTLMGTQGGHVTQQVSAPKFQALKPGETGAITQGTNIVNSTQAPVPDAYAAAHQGVVVNTANWLMKNVPNLRPQDAFNMAKQANSMSREQFVANIMSNPTLNPSTGNPAQAAQRFSAIYDQLRAQGGAGLSSVPGSNTSPSDTINSLIGGADATQQSANAVANPFQPSD